MADGERRIVGQRGPDSDGDGVAVGPQRMHGSASLVAREPPRLARRIDDSPVDRDRQLQGDVRAIRSPRGEEERRVLIEGLALEHPAIDGDLGQGEARRAAGRCGVRIMGREDHPRHAGGDERLGTGAGLSGVIAGLERDVGRGSTRSRAGGEEGHDFGVGLAILGVPPFADYLALLDDDGANLGVGRHAAGPARGEFESATHEAHVVGRCRRDVRL